MSPELITKYNVPGPRYTSYPTVPYWQDNTFNKSKWIESVQQSFKESNDRDGISLYIHLPFCESLCTFCACTKRITQNHNVEDPYIDSVIAEWKIYVSLLSGNIRIQQIHLGGGTPTFFSPLNLQRLIKAVLENAVLTYPSEQMHLF